MHTALQSKALAVLHRLRDREFYIEETRIRVDGTSEKFLAGLINAWRRKIHVNVDMHPPGLNKYLRDPERAPIGFLTELTHALGLMDLGFDETIWDNPLSDILDWVDDSINGGVLARVLQHPVDQDLFKLQPTKSLSFDFGDTPNLAHFPNIPEFTVEAGELISTQAVMRFPGYLRVIAADDGEFIGLNQFMDIPTGEIPVCQQPFRAVPASPRIARTIVFAFAATDKAIFKDWPLTHAKSARLNHGSFLQLVNRFYSVDPDRRHSNVQSFITKRADGEKRAA